MNELPRKAADIVRNGELEDCGIREIYDLADELGIDVSLLSKREAIRRLEREVKRADHIKWSHEVQGPWIQCQIEGCEVTGFTTAPFERHEMAPGIWFWICFGDVVGAGLYEGK